MLQDLRPPGSSFSGRPSADLQEVFAVEASRLISHPWVAALAVRHLETRCDALLGAIDTLEASLGDRRL